MKLKPIKAKETTIIVAGLALDAYQMPEEHYKLSLSQLATKLGLQPTQLRRLPGLQLLPAESLKVKPRAGQSGLRQAVLLGTAEISEALMEFAIRGNQSAKALMIALATETFEHRCDYAFGIKKTEVQYEASLANLYRRLRDEHKKQYIPYLTHWTKVDYPKGSAINYGVRTNQLKVAAGIRSLSPVDYMTTEELMVWNAAEIRYDAFRRAGYWHERALKEISKDAAHV